MKEYFKEFYTNAKSSKLEENYGIRAQITENVNSQEGIFNNIYRVHSDKFIELIHEARKMMEDGVIEFDDGDKDILESDLGQYVEFEDTMVPLDCPMVDNEIDEAEYQGDDVELNSPKRGGPKKYYVYVKNSKGNVVKVNFGDSGDLKSKINDPEARKNFASRHKCSEKKDKTTPGYWSCNLPRYAKQLGLSGGGNYYW
jgi:hypothetical protein